MPNIIPPSVDELLSKMVRLNTVNAAASGDMQTEAKLGQYLGGVARAMGFGVRVLPVAGRAPNVLVTFDAGKGKPWLMFESHMDTVTTANMTINPHGGEIKDGKVWGRGSCDTKGTGAAMLWALYEYSKQKEQPQSIAIAFTVDEEFGMTGVRSLVKDWPGLGFTPVGVIVGEPTMLRPIVAHNGAVRIRITIKGKATHSSMPHTGINAVSMAARVVVAIEEQYSNKLTGSHPLTGRAVSSVTMVHGGTQVNVIPDRCVIDMDRRLVPGENMGEAVEAVRAVVEGVERTSCPRMEYEMNDCASICPPLVPELGEGLMRVIEKVLAAEGLETKGVGAPYATDAGDLSAAGIPAVVIGPGDGRLAHTEAEYVELAEIHRGVGVYRGMMGTVVE